MLLCLTWVGKTGLTRNKIYLRWYNFPSTTKYRTVNNGAMAVSIPRNYQKNSWWENDNDSFQKCTDWWYYQLLFLYTYVWSRFLPKIWEKWEILLELLLLKTKCTTQSSLHTLWLKEIYYDYTTLQGLLTVSISKVCNFCGIAQNTPDDVILTVDLYTDFTVT